MFYIASVEVVVKSIINLHIFVDCMSSRRSYGDQSSAKSFAMRRIIFNKVTFSAVMTVIDVLL